eukprot:scaffold3223_cov115-Isochrysis_galbana.AAC.3
MPQSCRAFIRRIIRSVLSCIGRPPGKFLGNSPFAVRQPVEQQLAPYFAPLSANMRHLLSPPTNRPPMRVGRTVALVHRPPTAPAGQAVWPSLPAVAVAARGYKKSRFAARRSYLAMPPSHRPTAGAAPPRPPRPACGRGMWLCPSSGGPRPKAPRRSRYRARPPQSWNRHLHRRLPSRVHRPSRSGARARRPEHPARRPTAVRACAAQ